MNSVKKPIPGYVLPILFIAVGAVFGALNFQGRDNGQSPVAEPAYFKGLTCIDIGENGFIYLGGENEIRVLDRDWNLVRDILISEPVLALSADATGNIYVGHAESVEKLSPGGRPLLRWGKEGTQIEKFKSVSGIACSGDDVFVADAGSRAVYRYTTNGEFLAKIDGSETDPKGVTFIVPSACLDCEVADGVLYVNNPGRFRVERYDFEGAPLDHWEGGSLGSERFPGCCNPTHLAILPDGNVVVSQKGEPCLKLFSPDGVLIEELGRGDFLEDEKGMDLAVDEDGKIYVVDSERGKVRIYEPAGTVVRTEG